MNQGSTTVHAGIGLGGALFLVLLVLKLTGTVAALSWPVVIGSLFAPAAFAVACTLLFLGCAFLVVLAASFFQGFFSVIGSKKR